MKLTAQTVQTPRTTKIRIDKIASDGRVIIFFTGSFVDHKDYAQAAKRLGVSEQHIATIVDGELRQGKNPAELFLTNKTAERPKYRVRFETGNANRAYIFDEFAPALQRVGIDSGMVIEWDGVEWTCNLDLDFGIHAPTPEQLIAFCETIKPAPAYYWLSRSNGLHLIYNATEVYTADELASVAGYHLLQRFPNGKVEFLHRSRCPANSVYTRHADTDIDSLRSLLLQPVETDCLAWLEEHGYEPGMRYAHTDCPVAPSERSKKNSPPVVVYEDHIFCFICNADGRCCGSRRAGYFPIPALAGGRVNTQIANAVNNFVHWNHAQHILRSTVHNSDHARLLYSSLMKLKHGDDIRIPMVFKACEPNGLVRYNGYWCDNLGRTVDLEKGSSIIRQLPHCHDLMPNGDTQINPATCEWLSKPVDQSTRGYYAVTPIRGIHITQYQDLPPNKIYNVLQSSRLASEDMANRRPEYVPAGHRMDYADAWNILEKVFPCIDRNYIELLIVGRGCMEHRSGLPPMIFCTGGTGKGKTSHAQIAAAICGDNDSVVQLKRERDRFMNGVLAAKNAGGFCIFDEYFKFAREAGLSNTEAIEQLLSFTEESLIYLIHIGSVPLGDLPLFIWCDSELPIEVQQHEQIGRRVIHHELYNALSWETSMRSAGINRPDRLRTDGTPEMISACNAILSHVIEKHFNTSATDFIETAKSMGFKLIRESAAIDDKKMNIRQFLYAIMDSKAIPTSLSDINRYSKRGFKIARSTGNDNLYQLYTQLQNEKEHNTPQCSAVSESDLMAILDAEVPCKLETRKHGLTYVFRIVSIDGERVNDEVLKP
jgi:hypothetical protein